MLYLFTSSVPLDYCGGLIRCGVVLLGLQYYQGVVDATASSWRIVKLRTNVPNIVSQYIKANNEIQIKNDSIFC